jgi:hypothetical protein
MHLEPSGVPTEQPKSNGGKMMRTLYVKKTDSFLRVLPIFEFMLLTSSSKPDVYATEQSFFVFQ